MAHKQQTYLTVTINRSNGIKNQTLKINIVWFSPTLLIQIPKLSRHFFLSLLRRLVTPNSSGSGDDRNLQQKPVGPVSPFSWLSSKKSWLVPNLRGWLFSRSFGQQFLLASFLKLFQLRELHKTNHPIMWMAITNQEVAHSNYSRLETRAGNHTNMGPGDKNHSKISLLSMRLDRKPLFVGSWGIPWGEGWFVHRSRCQVAPQNSHQI